MLLVWIVGWLVLVVFVYLVLLCVFDVVGVLLVVVGLVIEVLVDV